MMLDRFFSKIWFPFAAVASVTMQMASSHRDVQTNEDLILAFSETPEPLIDTVKYSIYGYRKYWTEEEKNATFIIDDSLLNGKGDGFGDIEDGEYGLRPAALDSLIPPDSLRLTDTFRYKYYAALRDSLCHVFVKDSLIAAGDSVEWPILDSLYVIDSAAFAEEAYWAWYATLDKKERKKADFERLMPIKQARLDSLKEDKENKKAEKDSIIGATPRILETYVFKDSMLYQRLVKWTHEQDFHKLHVIDNADTGYNYRFYDYPFMREDVNAAWLGVAGSPVQYFDFSKRKSKEGVTFYDAEESWSYNPQTLPMYNTKTPYTELAYFGTLFAGASKESDNLHLMTTQNITPEANITLGYERFGGAGILANETTTNKTAYIAGNYIGKKYLMHAGYIYNMISRDENGGVLDNFDIRDTTIDAREAKVRLSNASSKIKKNTLFLDQQYRIPLSFIKDIFAKGAQADTLEAALPEVTEESQEGKPGPEEATDLTVDEAEATKEEADSTGIDTEVTTAFIGHSSELSTYYRTYQDKISNDVERQFFNNVFNLNPNTSFDSLRVMKLDNKVFMRLQPWSDEGIVSKLDVGAGERLMNYYKFDPTYLHEPSNYHWNATYVYAGVEGQFKKYMEWDAKGHYVLLGDESNDFDLSANLRLNLFPFRRDKQNPVIIKGHFETSLEEPEYYTQHLLTNHFKWENEFSKISTTSIQGSIAIPKWNLGAEVTYTLLANNLFYDTLGIVRQNTEPMSILSASLHKDFTVAKLLHFDHRALFQISSNEEVVPLPMVALNARYYIQFALGENDALHMQIGANAWYNTAWYAPSWNPVLGVFHNQNEVKYGNAPYFDIFANLQWKRACIFVKLENAGMGWPLDKADYFSANHYIRTQRVVKFGMFWPFYTQPSKDTSGDKGPNPD